MPVAYTNFMATRKSVMEILPKSSTILLFPRGIRWS